MCGETPPSDQVKNARARPPSRRSENGPERLRRLLVAGTGEGDQWRGGKRGLFDRRHRVFLEVALQAQAYGEFSD